MKVLGVLVFGAVAAIGVSSKSVYAEGDHVPAYHEPDKEKTQMELRGEKEAQDAYKRSLQAVPDKGPVDPWGNVRSDSAPKPAAKPHAKTGNAAK